MKSETIVKTPQASRYLRQLCKHFAHKIETRHDNYRGTCIFPHSTAELAATEETLAIAIEAADRHGLESGQSVVWTHLVRFAFREDLGAPDWRIVPEA